MAIALAVAAIPEGLPVAVTVALSIATRRMARRNVIVRHLPAVEGLGSCTVVASDKTGTLTANALTAKRLWLPGRRRRVEVGGEGYDPRGEFRFLEVRDEAGEPRRLVGGRRLRRRSATTRPSTRRQRGHSGDTVDVALLVLAAKAGLAPPRSAPQAPRIGEIPFAAERRFAATLNRHADGLRLHAKGAPEVLVPLCVNASEDGASGGRGDGGGRAPRPRHRREGGDGGGPFRHLRHRGASSPA